MLVEPLIGRLAFTACPRAQGRDLAPITWAVNHEPHNAGKNQPTPTKAQTETAIMNTNQAVIKNTQNTKDRNTPITSTNTANNEHRTQRTNTTQGQ